MAIFNMEYISSIFNESNAMSTMKNLKIIYPCDKYKIKKEIKYIDKTGSENILCMVDGINTLCRGRSEIIIFKDNKILLNFYKNNPKNCQYKFPGGGWGFNETHIESAERECKEEVRIVPNNTKFGSRYIYIYPEISDKLKSIYDKKYWYKGSITDIFVADYERIFDGYVADIDKSNMINQCKWYDVDSIYEDLPKYYQDAINNYYNR